MPVSLAADPIQLYRIGRAPDPLAWPPIQFAGFGRYDDPRKRTSTLYAAVERQAVFLETLDTFRPAPALLALLPAHPDARAGIVAPDYFRRLLIRFRTDPGRRWLDIRAPETQEHLRHALAKEIVEIGLGDRFVLGDLITRDHELTRVIAGWAVDEGFDGIAYASCHDPALTCWAIFETVTLTPVGAPEPVTREDPNLREVARMWNLRLP